MSLPGDEFNLCSTDSEVIGGAGAPGVAAPGVGDRAMKSRIVSARAVMASVISSLEAMAAIAHSEKNGCDKLE